MKSIPDFTRWTFPLAMISIMLINGQANAQTSDWTNTSNNNSYWHVGSNWGPAGPPGATDTARFNTNATYDVWWNGMTASATPEVGFLQVSNGNVTFLNRDLSPQHRLIINGSGGNGLNSDFSISGSTTSFTNSGLHLINLGGAEITDGATMTLDGSHSAGTRLTVAGATGLDVSGTLNVRSGAVVSSSRSDIGRLSGSSGTATVSGSGSQWNNSSGLRIGNGSWGNGILNVEAGGQVNNSFAYVGLGQYSTGVVTVTGSGSQWNNSSNLYLGYLGNATLNVEAGGVVTGTDGIFGISTVSTGVATVTGAGSQWNNSGTLYLGHVGSGVLNVEAGGVVTSTDGNIGNSTLSTGVAIVTGIGSQWNNSSDLLVGSSGSGTLSIASGGKVVVGGTTSIGSLGAVTLSGSSSRFEFGETSLAEFSGINAVSGSMAGNLNHAGFTDVASMTALQNTAVDLSDVTLTNSGTLYGNGLLGNALINSTSGQLQTVAGERMRFAGNGNTNAGEINNFGGTVLFAQDVTNDASGFITGRGVFEADGGWTNQGVMAFSGGPADILGDVELIDGGRVVTSGGATTTFFDDVLHNGSEIRTAAGSNSVFFGSVSGASGFTGLGTVFMEGDLRPGNSPGILAFEGNLVLGSGADTIIELGGYLPGDFDQLQVAHDLTLNGDLFVELYDGFQLAFNDEFLIGDVDGSLFGQFNGLSEGDLVGNFGGMDLFITYTAGNGNDVGLFAAVPEPGSFAFFSAGLIGLALFYRRRSRV